jgi:hypothetical protein
VENNDPELPLHGCYVIRYSCTGKPLPLAGLALNIPNSFRSAQNNLCVHHSLTNTRLLLKRKREQKARSQKRAKEESFF